MSENAEDLAMQALFNGETNIPNEPPIGNEPIIPEVKPEENPEAKPEEKAEEGFWSGYGEFENEEAFKASYEEMKANASKNEEQSILWQEKEKGFQATIEEEKAKQNLYIADDNLARLNVLKNSNEDSYNFYKKLVLNDKPNSLDIITSNISKQFADATDTEVKEYIIDKYGLDLEKPNEDDYDEGEYDKVLSKYNRNMKFAQMKMEDDAKGIYNDYMTDFNNIELPYNKPLSKEELVVKQNTTLEKWQPHIEDLTKSVGNMSFNIKTDDGDVPIELSLNDEQTAKYSKVLSGLVHDNAIDFNSEGQKSVGDIMSTIILKDQLQGLLDNVWTKAVEEVSAKYEKQINGGSTPKFSSSHKGTLNTEDEAMNVFRQQLDGQ